MHGFQPIGTRTLDRPKNPVLLVEEDAAADALMERSTDGLHVAIRWLPNAGEIILQAERCGESVATTVPDDRVLDAFEHPTLYLRDEQVAKLYPSGTPGQ